jgi:hypothetical protein
MNSGSNVRIGGDYFGSRGGNDPDVNVVGAMVSQAGTLRNLYVIGNFCTTSASNRYVFTVNVQPPGGSAADTAITCTLQGATTCNDTTHTVVIAAGAVVSVHVTQAGSPGPYPASAGVQVTP